MVTKRELLDAIRECEISLPSLSVCERLAVFYSLYERLYGSERQASEKHVKSVDVQPSDR